MSKHSWIRKFLYFLPLLILTFLLLHVSIQKDIALSQLASLRTILNNVWDRSNHRLMVTSWAGAQGGLPLETEQTIFNDIWDQAGNSLRTNNEVSTLIITEDQVSQITSCTKGQSYYIPLASDPALTDWRCNLSEDGLEPRGSTSGSSGPLTIAGISTGTTGVTGLKCETTTITGNAVLETSCIVKIDATNNLTLTLPPVSSAPVSFYWLKITTGTGIVTIQPSGTDLLNNTNTPKTFSGLNAEATLVLYGDKWGLTADIPLPPTNTVYSTADYAPTSDATVGFDPTRDMYVAGGSGVSGSFPRILSVTRPGQTLTNSTTNDQDFNSIFTIPANYLLSGRKIEVRIEFRMITDAGPSTTSFYMKLGATKCYQQRTTSTPSTSVDYYVTISYFIYGTAAPGAAVNVECTPGENGPGNASPFSNTTAVTTHATNGTLNIVPGIDFGTSTGGESLTVVQSTIIGYN